MDFTQVWSSAPPISASMDVEIARTQSLYHNVAIELERSRKSIHACCTTLERWSGRIRYLRANYLKERSYHASTRRICDEMKRAYRDLRAHTALNSSGSPESLGQATQTLQLISQLAMPTSNHHIESQGYDAICPSLESKWPEMHVQTPTPHTQHGLEIWRPSAPRGRKRKRSESEL